MIWTGSALGSRAWSGDREAASVRKAERARRSEETQATKERFVAGGRAARRRQRLARRGQPVPTLLDEWKALPRLDRATDDELWHRFSTARTTYTRRRRPSSPSRRSARDGPGRPRRSWSTEAEALADSTDWGPTTGAYRDLMTRWKAAGRRPAAWTTTLWQRFRAAQDTFFAAKQAAQTEQDTEFRANAEAKEALLVEAERLLPVRDPVADRGGVPRPAAPLGGDREGAARPIKPLDTRLRAVRCAIKQAERIAGGANNPEARARAEDTAAKLEAQITALEQKAAKAEARGDTRAAQRGHPVRGHLSRVVGPGPAAASDFGG